MSTDQDEPELPLERVVVIGNTGSGKTTFARRLAERLGSVHVELDALYWESGWTPTETKRFRDRVGEATRGTRWVVDGGYLAVRDILWARAQSVVWLDYGLPVIMGRLLGRTVRRVRRREELWSGNRDSWRKAFASRDSLFLWALSSHRRKRREYPAHLRDYPHLRWRRFQRPGEAEAWLRALPGPQVPEAAPAEPSEAVGDVERSRIARS